MDYTLFAMSFITILNTGQCLQALSPEDPSSYSRPELAIVKHISLALSVDFDEQVFNGEATLNLDVLDDINDLPLDISKLTIEGVEEVGGSQLQFNLGDHIPNVGSKLNILLAKQANKGEKLKIRIKYKTDPSASALTWMKAPQTSGKKYPYLFSQSSPIHARSILPCQDTPAVKFTYDAEVTAPEHFTVLMSALRGQVTGNKTSFNQPLPVPSNLFAIAVGVLESRIVGPRSKIWSEKEDVERNAYEFAETEKYLEAAEKMCGPYDWTEYDLLVLPPSFPHGAMENTCLTFYSPTVVVGDRSLSDVTIHEIMHSWTGNSASIKNFEHFWLKEGFTVFLERKVTASLINDTAEAKRNRDFHSLLGLQQLIEGVNTLGHTSPLTKLVLDLDGVHPDEAFSIIPYEKGSLFLRYLEDLFGGPAVFDDYIRSYVSHFRMQSLDTDQFKAHFLDYFKNNDKLAEVDWDTWLNGVGMPPVIPDYDTTLTQAVTTLISKIEDPSYSFSYDDVKSFNVHQLMFLLQQLYEKPALPLDRLKRLGEEYKISGNKNNEILYRWLRLLVRSRDETIVSEVFTFLNSLGRLKYVRPLYRELYAWEEVRQQAIDNFLQNEQYMSHLTSYNLRKDLHLD
ncbi:leukotriene A-4 hydrolase-like [Anticarsia gemmatalis]|uniref:leukotriene A-4 hydrolase-like n=1 Tax=Anticarsia gemmatalis TaxID=129554 RepID=UPI003F75ACC1